MVCTNHQSLQSWCKENFDSPTGPGAGRARWHQTLAKFDWSVVYVPGNDIIVANCLSCWAYPGMKAGMENSMHGEAEETAEAKRIIEAERVLQEGEAKCFVVMGSTVELTQV